MTITEFSKLVHENAVNHGWWTPEREYGTILALIHSEISEAWECESECMSEKIPAFSAEAEELADVVIRILDFIAYLGKDYEKISTMPKKRTYTRDGWFMQLNWLVSNALECFRNEDETNALAWLKTCSEEILTSNLVQLAMYAKHDYNVKRPYRHGGKVF